MHLVRFLFSSLFVEKFHICFDLEFVRRLKFQTLFNKTGFSGNHNLSLQVESFSRDQQDLCYKL